MKRVSHILIPAAAVLIVYRLIHSAAPSGETASLELPSQAASAVVIPSSPPPNVVLSPSSPKVGEKATQNIPKAEWDPTAQQKHVLNESRKDEEDWEKQREKFLDADLKLSESEQAAIGTLRQATATQEAALMARPVAGEAEESAVAAEIRANRVFYEEKVRATLGKSRFLALSTFYTGQWKSDGLGAYLPLK